jgi:thiosulfate/3-mercaptopyruvate sulfurtransferase
MSQLVSTDWLAGHLHDPDVQIVDATWFMPGDPRSGREEYLKAHIPGAVFFDIDEISDHTTDLPHMLPSPEAFAEAIAALGLRRDIAVVVYDAQGIFSAPRAWWSLGVMGFSDVYVLDGGLKAWMAEDRPVEGGMAHPKPRPRLSAYDAERVRDLEAMKRHLAARDVQVVDARAAARFRGEAPEPREGLPSGHMPGAYNVPWSEVVTAQGYLASPDAIRAAFERAGVNLAYDIVTTCGSGVSAAILALALTQIGYEDVPVYDGSWTEWASRKDTEIITGP